MSDFTEAYLAWWIEGLAAKENCPKLAAKAKLYAEFLVETHDLTTGAGLLRCEPEFLTKECGMAKIHVHLMMDKAPRFVQGQKKVSVTTSARVSSLTPYGQH